MNQTQHLNDLLYGQNNTSQLFGNPTSSTEDEDEVTVQHCIYRCYWTSNLTRSLIHASIDDSCSPPCQKRYWSSILRNRKSNSQYDGRNANSRAEDWHRAMYALSTCNTGKTRYWFPNVHSAVSVYSEDSRNICIRFDWIRRNNKRNG